MDLLHILFNLPLFLQRKMLSFFYLDSNKLLTPALLLVIDSVHYEQLHCFQWYAFAIVKSSVGVMKLKNQVKI